MTRIFQHRIAVAGTLALALSLSFVASALSQEAQVLNPLYIQARDWWTKVSAAPLPSDIKAPLGERFGHLSRMQQNLWSLAGQVDSGSCTGDCFRKYNQQVIAWQQSLSLFNRDAENTLRMVPAPDPRPPAVVVPWGK